MAIVFLRLVYQSSTIWENLSLVNLLLVYISWWMGLISMEGLRRISYREKVRWRWSLKREGISGRIGTRTIDLRETLQGSLDLPTLKRLMLYFESQCNRSWRRLRTNRSLNGRIRWQEILWIITKTFTAIIIRIMDTLLRIAKIYGIIWNNWSERGCYSISCITLVAEEVKWTRCFGEMLLQDLLWAP